MNHLRSFLVGGLVLLSVGCVTDRGIADRAYESEDYDKALVHYKEVIQEGTNDWKAYYRAAKAANYQGNFSLAEKYYGRALRHGGGAKVVREFADFYIKTSNYSRAVRLLQFLLKTDADKQTVYNNLGTALMYAGAPLDAESYLLLAQQLAPSDPVPYVNLGVLYERHLNNPGIALGFYNCYLKYAEGDQQRRSVRARVQQLQGMYGSSPASRVECGEPYQPGGVDPNELRAEIGEAGDSAGTEAGGAKSSGEENDGEEEPIDISMGESDDGNEKGDMQERDRSSEGVSSRDGAEVSDSSGGSKEGPEPKFEGVQVISKKGADAESGSDRGAGDRPEAEGEGERADASDAGSSKDARESVDRERSDSGRDSGGHSSESTGGGERLHEARRAYENGDYQAVVDRISGMSVEQMGPEATRLFGLSLTELGEFERARRWLETAVRESPTPEVVGGALETYDQLGARSDIERICRDFSDREDYQEVLEDRCPEKLTPRELDKEALEQYRESVDR